MTERDITAQFVDPTGVVPVRFRKEGDVTRNIDPVDATLGGFIAFPADTPTMRSGESLSLTYSIDYD